MLEKVDLTKKISKEEYKEKMPLTRSEAWETAERVQSIGYPGPDRIRGIRGQLEKVCRSDI